MRVLLVVLLAAVLLSSSGCASKKHSSAWFWASTAAVVGANILDSGTSWGAVEANPLLRGGNGRFGSKGAGVKLSITGAVIAGEYFLSRKSPKAARVCIVGNTLWAGYYAGVATDNYQKAR